MDCGGLLYSLCLQIMPVSKYIINLIKWSYPFLHVPAEPIVLYIRIDLLYLLDIDQ